MIPVLRRTTDRAWWVRAWYGFPLSDPVSGAWSFTRTAAAALLATEVYLMLHQLKIVFATAPVAAVFLGLVIVTLAYALGGKTFEAIALGALGRYTKTDTNSEVHTHTTVVEQPVGGAVPLTQEKG
jgi:hypothetical protein